MRVFTFTLGALATNCYLCVEPDVKEAVAIDAGERPEPLLAALRQEGVRLTHILVTHLHADHICGAGALAAATGAPILASPEDAFLQHSLQGRGDGRAYPPVPPFDFEPLSPGKRLVLGQPLLVLDTPGHTPGGLSFFFPRAGAVFVGDALFRGSVGRTDFDAGDGPLLLRSIRERLFILPDATVVYPGHGPATTVGQEKIGNPFFRETNP
jgi:glyoxylase-like metal-dependent hydrolase (beta-lactamase superfamily II)